MRRVEKAGIVISIGSPRQRRTKAAPKSESQADKNKKTPLALRQRDHFVKGAFGRILGG